MTNEADKPKRERKKKVKPIITDERDERTRRRIVFYLSNFLYILESRAILNERERVLFDVFNRYTLGQNAADIRDAFDRINEADKGGEDEDN